MKSVLAKRYVRWNCRAYVLVGYFIVVGGAFTMLRTALKRLPLQHGILGVLIAFFGVIFIIHAEVVRGQREIKKSINDLREKIDELKEKK